MPVYRELKNRKDFERYYQEKREGILMLKNSLRELNEEEKETPPKRKSYLDRFLKKNTNAG